MHEKLKMQINLSCHTAKKGKDSSTEPHPIVTDPQSICGRMDHGTFYMIYLNFHSYEEKKVGGKMQYYYNLSFFLQNFDGSITMGLDPYQNIKPIANTNKNAKDPDDFDYQIPIKVQPFSTNHVTEQVQWVFDKPIKGKVLDIYIDMLLSPSTIYNHNDLDRSEYVDPILWYRDGEHYLRVDYALRDGITGVDELEQAFGKDIIQILSSYDAQNGTDFLEDLKDAKKRGYGKPKTKVCYPRRVSVS